MLTPIRIATAVLLIASLHIGGCASTPGDGARAPRTANAATAESLIVQIEQVEFPAFDPERRDDEEYRLEYRAQFMAAQQRQGSLIRDLYRAAPRHEKTAELLPRRWQAMMWDAERQDELRKELRDVASRHAGTDLGRNARFTMTQMEMNSKLWGSPADRNPTAALRLVEDYIAAEPDDPRAASMLAQVAGAYDFGSDEQIRLYDRVRREHPDSRSAHAAAGKLRQIASIGTPFELTFTCAVTGSEVDVASLRGKVVVIDFWATWCGPCVAKMPEFKELYAKYEGGAGGRVEFIGISLDQPEEQGGLDRLLDFVAENEIPWPQFYQGNGWESEFSRNWGINAIPTIFAVDTHGMLRSTTARMGLDELIAELLEEAVLAGGQLGG
jgi:thiol-disulfide isomerase/thioredoxin